MLYEDENPLQKLHHYSEAMLTLPHEDKENPIAKKLGAFLIDKGYIKGINTWRGSWGFKYEDGIISLAERPMPEEAYNYYIFRLGEKSETGQSLYPQGGRQISIGFCTKLAMGIRSFYKIKKCQMEIGLIRQLEER